MGDLRALRTTSQGCSEPFYESHLLVDPRDPRVEGAESRLYARVLIGNTSGKASGSNPSQRRGRCEITGAKEELPANVPRKALESQRHARKATNPSQRRGRCEITGGIFGGATPKIFVLAAHNLALHPHKTYLDKSAKFHPSTFTRLPSAYL